MSGEQNMLFLFGDEVDEAQAARRAELDESDAALFVITKERDREAHALALFKREDQINADLGAR